MNSWYVFYTHYRTFSDILSKSTLVDCLLDMKYNDLLRLQNSEINCLGEKATNRLLLQVKILDAFLPLRVHYLIVAHLNKRAFINMCYIKEFFIW